MIDATYLKVHRTASSLRAKKEGADDQRGRLIGRTKGGLNTKLQAVTDAKGRPLKFFMTAGQVSDYTGAAALLSSLPAAEWMIADRGYDADWFRDAFKDKGIRACIPSRKSRGKAVRYDKWRYRRRNRIEIMFGRLKDWRRVATRYDRSANTFLSAVALAATVFFWLERSMSLDPRQPAPDSANYVASPETPCTIQAGTRLSYLLCSSSRRRGLSPGAIRVRQPMPAQMNTKF